MIAIDNVLVSEDIIEKQFVCNLNACKGVCCVAGDSGAPLDKSELKILKKEFKNYKDYLSDAGIKSIEENGFAVFDEEDDKYKTPLLANGACAYITYDTNKIASCGIEKAFLDKKTDFQKPISCHLYPIRIAVLKNDVEAVNYEKWSICKDACALGKQLNVPIYKFVKTALVRKYGEEFYNAIDAFANQEK